MDPTAVLLAVTHVAAFVAGGVTVRWLMVRNLRVRDVEGHAVLEVRPHDHHH